ncbi:hypothetical protein M407DRAFT_33539 [Tulasnella calospora MUT 4182]|uniref:Uncharacterized protein n=1 Tax=Tulasnella calospora MUT 4182 TaxID=1051891 RepID=A0A0C3K605_9AGAM|nr:hypothetical protein M407DRAFT_33539 [Tulasnella calospora MUT 4182]
MPPDGHKTSVPDAVGTTEPDAELKPSESKSTSLKAQTKRLGKKLLNKDMSSEAMPTGGSESAGRQPAVQANAPPSNTVDRTDFDPLAESATSSGTPLPSRRMIILPIGIKPHRARAWTSSARPGESVMRYVLFNGQCPSVVVPVKPGSPLVAWHTPTLAQLGEIGKGGGVEGVVRILLEYVELCVDWERMLVVVSKGRIGAGGEKELKMQAIKDALTLLVGNLVEAGQSQDVKEKVDLDRAEIVFFRLP